MCASPLRAPEQGHVEDAAEVAVEEAREAGAQEVAESRKAETRHLGGDKKADVDKRGLGSETVKVVGSREGEREGEEEGGLVGVGEQTGADLSLQQSPTLVPATAASDMPATAVTVKAVTVKAAVMSTEKDIPKLRVTLPGLLAVCSLVAAAALLAG